MGLNIGTNVAAVAAAGDAASRQQARAQDSLLRQEEVLPPRRRDQVEIRAGFGENTITLPFLALRTVNRNIESARETIPTREEIRARFQENLSRQRDQAAELAQAQEDVGQAQAAASQRVLPGPSAQVQTFADREPEAVLSQPARPELSPGASRELETPSAASSSQKPFDTVNRIDILI